MVSMKKSLKVILIIVVLLGLSAFGFRMVMNHQISETYDRLDAVAVIDLSAVEDDVYEGTEETALVKVTVKVEVKDHKMTDIQLIRHENGKRETGRRHDPGNAPTEFQRSGLCIRCNHVQ